VNFGGRGFTLFRIAGIPVEFRLGFLVIVFLVALPFVRSFDPVAFLLAGILLLVLVGSVFMHELGHVAAARTLGVRTERITFDWYGGIALLNHSPASAGARIYFFLAGPAVTLILFGLAVLIRSLLGNAGPQTPVPGLRDYLQVAIDLAAQVNLLLLVFNLLPAFPMDGGQILAALLERPFGRRMSRLIVACLGSALALAAAIAVIAGYTALAMAALLLAIGNITLLRRLLRR
jgi:Zn-dependent protease